MTTRKPSLSWLLVPISVAAFLATWGGWAKLATMTGYTQVEMLGGQEWSRFNIGFVLPMSVEPFGMLAMSVAFNTRVRRWARLVAGGMALATLIAAGICQSVVHSLTVRGETRAPDAIVSVTSVLPVVVLGLGAALAMLNAARVPDTETSPETSRPSVLGRLSRAIGDAAVTRIERLAETSQPSPPEATQSSQASRPDALNEQTEPLPVLTGTSEPAGPESSPGRVPAAQPAPTAPRPGRDELIREVVRLRGETHPETQRPWSYAQIADRLGISKSEAGRLGKEAEQARVRTIEFPAVPEETSHGDDSETRGVLVGAAGGEPRAA
jgi:hypothetical protein